MKKNEQGTMNYRGYTAGIRYSPEDECLVGRVLGIVDVVGFHGDGVAEIRRAFVDAVDAYLEDCREMGRNPDRPYSGKMNLRLPPELHRALSVKAESTGQSLNDLIVDAIAAATK